MSKSETSKTSSPSKTDKATKAATKAERKSEREKEFYERMKKACAEASCMARLVGEESNKLALDLLGMKPIAPGAYATAKLHANELTTLLNKLALYLPRPANEAKQNATTVKAAKPPTAKSAKAEQTDIPEDDGPEDDDNAFDDQV